MPTPVTTGAMRDSTDAVPTPGHGLVTTVTCTGGGGAGWAGQKPKGACVPKADLQFRAHLINFIFLLGKIFLMWVGGWVGQAAEPRQPFRPSPLPSPGNPKPWPGQHCGHHPHC